MKQKKKAKICFVIYIAGVFFFKKNSVMKCLRSKKKTERCRLYYSRAHTQAIKEV
jgi:flavoprotein